MGSWPIVACGNVSEMQMRAQLPFAVTDSQYSCSVFVHMCRYFLNTRH
jgi:hypothetical protein